MKKCLSLLVLATLITGCAADKHAEIPANASLVVEGTKVLVYTAPRDGMIWVYNKFNGNMEWAGGVLKGDTVTVDPDKDKIFVNGRTVNDKPLTEDDKKIYFQPNSTVVTERSSPAVEQKRIYDANGNLVEVRTVEPGTTVREYHTERPQ